MAKQATGEREGGSYKLGIALGTEGAYEPEETEAESLKFLVENSCISCDKILPRYAVRILPPLYVQERDRHVRSGLVSRRLMCVDCYNSFKIAHRHRIKKNPMAIASPFAKQEVTSFLLK